MTKNIIILGGLGNGSVIAGAIDDANARGDDEWKMAGYLNDRMENGEKIHAHPVLGDVADAAKFVEEGYYFINTIYRIDGQQERVDFFEGLGISEDRLATFVHPLSYVAPDVKMAPGVVVMPNVCISSGAILDKGCLIMVAATIGHDTYLGPYTHVAAQACVGAYLKIGQGVHIGLNSTIRENITIGKNSTLGMGSVLTKDIGESEIWVGSPAKFLRMAE
jgi:acetyltransferase EpsM